MNWFKKKFGKTIVDFDGPVGRFKGGKFIPEQTKFYYREISRDIKRFLRIPLRSDDFKVLKHLRKKT